jgi:hypothetical protein
MLELCDLLGKVIIPRPAQYMQEENKNPPDCPADCPLDGKQVTERKCEAPSDRVKLEEGALFLCPGGFHMKQFL